MLYLFELGVVVFDKNCGGSCVCVCCCCCWCGCFINVVVEGLLVVISFVFGCGVFFIGDLFLDDWENLFFFVLVLSFFFIVFREDLIILIGRVVFVICVVIDWNVIVDLIIVCGRFGIGGGKLVGGITGGEVAVGLVWDVVVLVVWVVVLVGEFLRGICVIGVEGVWNWRLCVGEVGVDLK